MSLRKKRQRIKSEPSANKKSFYKIIIVITSIIVIFIAILYYFVLNAFDQNRVVIAKYTGDNKYSIQSYNLSEGNYANIKIPSNTYLESSRQRGFWRLESIRRIILDESLESQTYADTMMKAFNVPVDYWHMGVWTNMSVPQRIRIFLIKNKFTNNSNKNIDLSESNLLKQSQLPDGEEGYLINTEFSTDIKRLFIDEEYASGGYRVEVQRHIDKNFQSATDLIEILTTMGLHVVNLKRETANDINCIIEAKPDVDVERLSRIFNCETTTNDQGNLDIRFIIGNKFAERF